MVAYFFDLPSKLEIDAFLHLGSFVAIVLYFFRDFKELWRWKWLIFLSALPGGLAGLILQHGIENYFRSPNSVATSLVVMTIPMFLGERFGKKNLSLEDLTPFKALLIGIAQALALIPGTSRSGITISAALLLGLKRDDAAKYSFLAGAPLIFGAGFYEGLELLNKAYLDLQMLMVGFWGSFLSSFLAIAFLIPFLRKHTLNFFILYRLILGLLLLLTLKAFNF